MLDDGCGGAWCGSAAVGAAIGTSRSVSGSWVWWHSAGPPAPTLGIHFAGCRALACDPRLPFPLGRSLLGLAALATEGDELHQAWDLAHDGLEIVHEYGDRVGAAAALEQIAELAVALGDPGRFACSPRRSSSTPPPVSSACPWRSFASIAPEPPR